MKKTIIIAMILIGCSKVSLTDRYKEYEDISLSIHELILSAIHNNDLYLLDHYLSEIKDINLPIGERGTFLHSASEVGNLDVVKRLLELGSDPLIKNSCGKYAYELTSDKNILNLINNYLIRREILIAANNKEYDIISVLLLKNKDILFLKVKNAPLLENLCNILSWKDSKEIFKLVFDLLKDDNEKIIYIKKRILGKFINDIKTREELNEYIDMLGEIKMHDKRYTLNNHFFKVCFSIIIDRGYSTELNKILQMEDFHNLFPLLSYYLIKNEGDVNKASFLNYAYSINKENFKKLSLEKVSKKDLDKLFNKEIISKLFKEIFISKERNKNYLKIIEKFSIFYQNNLNNFVINADEDKIKKLIVFNFKNPVNLGHLFIHCLFRNYRGIAENLISHEIFIEELEFLEKFISQGLLNILINTDFKEAIKKLLKITNLRFNNEEKLLEYFLLKADEEAFKILMQRGNKINIDSEIFLSILENGSIEFIISILNSNNNIDIKFKNKLGWNSLMIACKKGNKELVKILLKGGANINDQNIEGFTALSISLINENPEISKLLLKCNNIDVTLKDSLGKTAIAYALNRSYFEISKIILAKGGNIDHRKIRMNQEISNLMSEFSLIEAMKSNNVDRINDLINKNINLEEKDSNGNTPFMIAISRKDEILLKALVRKIYKVKDTPLIEAINSGDKDLIKIYIDNNLFLEERGLDGKTPFLLAIDKRDENLIKILAKKIYNIEEAYLIEAINSRNEALIKIYIDNNLFLKEKNLENDTPLSICFKRGNIDLSKILISQKY